MKKTLKVLLAVVITPIALFLILTLLLYCPPVQKWAVEKAAQVASEKTGMRITVEQLRLSFPLDLRLQGLKGLSLSQSVVKRLILRGENSGIFFCFRNSTK